MSASQNYLALLDLDTYYCILTFLTLSELCVLSAVSKKERASIQHLTKIAIHSRSTAFGKDSFFRISLPKVEQGSERKATLNERALRQELIQYEVKLSEALENPNQIQILLTEAIYFYYLLSKDVQYEHRIAKSLNNTFGSQIEVRGTALPPPKVLGLQHLGFEIRLEQDTESKEDKAEQKTSASSLALAEPVDIDSIIEQFRLHPYLSQYGMTLSFGTMGVLALSAALHGVKITINHSSSLSETLPYSFCTLVSFAVSLAFFKCAQTSYNHVSDSAARLNIADEKKRRSCFFTDPQRLTLNDRVQIVDLSEEKNKTQRVM